jgi:DNA invertase Pin-like site-specific DNA recombinase
MTNKKAFAYLRVSSKNQLNGDGFDRQLSAIQDYAKRHGHKIVQVFEEEGVSGSTDETARPAFQSMIAEILRDGTRTIILERLDRLARQYRIQEHLVIYLASKGIELISADTGENITRAIHDDPMKKALIQVQGIFAELEKGLLSKKLRKAREKIRATGKKVEGRKSYSELAPELVKEIRRLRRKPRNKGRRKTYAEIATILNERGIRTLTGKEFTHKTIYEIVRKASGKVA